LVPEQVGEVAKLLPRTVLVFVPWTEVMPLTESTLKSFEPLAFCTWKAAVEFVEFLNSADPRTVSWPVVSVLGGVAAEVAMAPVSL
jgi:hypothetical protein